MSALTANRYPKIFLFDEVSKILSLKRSATVEAELIANDKVCATCKGLFVIVKEDHPVYHRW